jgi:hypothetical protein
LEVINLQPGIPAPPSVGDLVPGVGDLTGASRIFKRRLFQHERISYADLRYEEKANLKKLQWSKTENIPEIRRVEKRKRFTSL